PHRSSTSIYPLSLHDALPICQSSMSLALSKLRVMFHDPLLIKTPKGMVPTERARQLMPQVEDILRSLDILLHEQQPFDPASAQADRKSTRLNSSHVKISYAVF